MSTTNKSSTTLDSAVDAEFEAVKKIMDALSKNWKRLSPDTRLWLKSRLEKLDTGKKAVSDVESERV